MRILNVDFGNVTQEELFSSLRQGFVSTLNVDCMMKLQKDREFHHIVRQAEYVLVDGLILMWAARFLGCPLRARLSGSDLFPSFLEYHKDNPEIRVFLLGAVEGVAARAAEIYNNRLGREIIVGTYSPPYGFENSEAACEEIITRVQASGANVLGMGVGAPKQEKWMHRHRERLSNIDIFFAIGATIDFMAGHKRRAPRWMSNLGIEWLFRLGLEPRRLWRRYLIEGMPFFDLLLKQRGGRYQSPFDDGDSRS